MSEATRQLPLALRYPPDQRLETFVPDLDRLQDREGEFAAGGAGAGAGSSNPCAGLQHRMDAEPERVSRRTGERRAVPSRHGAGCGWGPARPADVVRE